MCLCDLIYIFREQIKGLMNYVEKDWNMLKDKKEVEILGRYTYFGNLFTFGFTSKQSMYT